MFIELIDHLRCPSPHEESWLVASARKTEGRYILEGTLGCPVCRAQYPVRDGVAHLEGVGEAFPLVAAPAEADPEEALRLAALLDLGEGSGFAVLLGGWGVHAARLAELVPVPLLLVDPPAGVEETDGVSIMRTASGAIPLAPYSARAVAIDEGNDGARLESAARLVRTKGRLLAPVTLAPFPDMRELARDERIWVAEREGKVAHFMGLAALRRARPDE